MSSAKRWIEEPTLCDACGARATCRGTNEMGEPYKCCDRCCDHGQYFTDCKPINQPTREEKLKRWQEIGKLARAAMKREARALVTKAIQSANGKRGTK